MVEPALTRPQGAHVRCPYRIVHAPMRVVWMCAAVLVTMCLVSLDESGRAQPRLMSGSLDVTWLHGAQDCQTNTDPPIQIHRYNEHTYILRQNKCINYEAPFLYLLFGGEKVFLQDTGATDAATRFPIRDTVQSIITQWLEAHNKRSIQLIVTHSHSHGDHIAGDEQFRGQPNTTVVDTTLAAVKRFFGITAWPTQIVPYDLGERRLDIIPVPGHEATHIAVYDWQTGILLTGDTLYPGRLYIRDWRAYKASISRLVAFSQNHPIMHVLGTHIEMSNVPGRDYPLGSTYQPQEHVLQLTPAHLLKLHDAVRVMRNTPIRKIFDDFIIYPL
jgi:hydroxyacylglutathione hydrolase